MNSMYYIGLDVHKKTISYCVKDVSGQIHSEGTIPATRPDLDTWMKTLPQPWTAAMEATIFTGWIYDHLLPHAAALKVAHPLMLRAIAAAKKKNDRIDARQDRRLPALRFSSGVLHGFDRDPRAAAHAAVSEPAGPPTVQLKNKIARLLMETGVSYNKQKLHKVGYFRSLLTTNPDIDGACGRCCNCAGRCWFACRKPKVPWCGRWSGSTAGEAGRAADDDPRRGPDHGADLGAGSGGCEALSFDQAGHQLLRAVQRREEFGGHVPSVRLCPSNATSICRRC